MFQNYKERGRGREGGGEREREGGRGERGRERGRGERGRERERRGKVGGGWWWEGRKDRSIKQLLHDSWVCTVTLNDVIMT